LQAAGKNARDVEIKIELGIIALIETYIPEMKVAEEKEDRCDVRVREEEEGRVRVREERAGGGLTQWMGQAWVSPCLAWTMDGFGIWWQQPPRAD
jgi:hypothetical protein